MNRLTSMRVTAWAQHHWSRQQTVPVVTCMLLVRGGIRRSRFAFEDVSLVWYNTNFTPSKWGYNATKQCIIHRHQWGICHLTTVTDGHWCTWLQEIHCWSSLRKLTTWKLLVVSAWCLVLKTDSIKLLCFFNTCVLDVPLSNVDKRC